MALIDMKSVGSRMIRLGHRIGYKNDVCHAPTPAAAHAIQNRLISDPSGAFFNTLPPFDGCDFLAFGEVIQGYCFADLAMRRAIALAAPQRKDPRDSDVANVLTGLLSLLSADSATQAELSRCIEEMKALGEIRNYVAHWMARKSHCGSFYIFNTNHRAKGVERSDGQVVGPLPSGKAVFAVVEARRIQRDLHTAMLAHDRFSLALFA